MQVFVNGGVPGAGDGVGLRIVAGRLAAWIEVWTLVAGVEATDGDAFVDLQLLGELTALDAEVGADKVVDRQADVTVQLLGDCFLLRFGEFAALQERSHVLTQSVLFHFSEERL